MEENKLQDFINYASKSLEGHERREAQLFLERLFIAFGHKGLIEAGATLEYPIKANERIKFCDLIWPTKVIIEMKKRGDNLSKYFGQAKLYWDNAYGKRTEYVILCNFDEFWIYNWNLQRDPLDKVKLIELDKRWRALAFLCQENIKPIFNYNFVKVTNEAADKIALLYQKLIDRDIEQERSRRFVLQCLVALFADHTGLLPREGFFSDIINEYMNNGEIKSDLFTLLFKHMNSKESVKQGRFKGVDYFNGGIFNKIYPIELKKDELKLLSEAATYDWSKVQPSIFGSIFEDSLHVKDRHKYGAHFTYESDIMRIVQPTVIRPWREKIAKAKTKKDFEKIREDLSNFKILDPACGSGNFLYVSYRELKHLELDLLQKMKEKYPTLVSERLRSVIKADNFYGIDTNDLGIELAKITLSMAKKFAADEFNKFTSQARIDGGFDKALPFYNLDKNIICADALRIDWPEVDVIIGNPPYQSKNKMLKEFGPEYMEFLHTKFPDMPGRADYCVYWLRKAHDNLKIGGRAGFVGTNTISQTYSRVGGLDYIISNDGVIIEAVSTMPWSGSAVVHVSIVNWIKGKTRITKRKLSIQKGEKKDGPWEEYELKLIPSSLSPKYDVTEAKILKTNSISKVCFQGQTHGHEGFLLTPEERNILIKNESNANEVIFPYLIADELVGTIDSKPERYIIDFQHRDSLSEVSKYKGPFEIIKTKVLPQMIINAEVEKKQYANLEKKITVRQNHLKKWWLFWREREDLIHQIQKINRYIACARVTKRPIFEFVSSKIRPNDALAVFAVDDDYSFGILQSTLHWEWFKERCSTLKADFRYTSDTVFDTFPWPQWGMLSQQIDTKKSEKIKISLALDVAKAAKELRDVRNKIRKESHLSLREIYRSLELPGHDEIKEKQKILDEVVWKAYFYGLPKKMQKKDILDFLLNLNEICFNSEKDGKDVIAPGLPPFCSGNNEFFSDDCIKPKL